MKKLSESALYKTNLFNQNEFLVRSKMEGKSV